MDNKEPGQLSMASVAPRYHQIGDSQQPLSVLVNRFRQERIRIPDFQRGDVWEDSKKQQYVEALESGNLPIGVIVTCHVEGDETVWLLDGLQRLSTLLDLVTAHENYGYTKENAEKLLESINVTCQHRIYRSMLEAVRWFQRINLGTELTNYEFYKGYLTLLLDYRKVIEPEIERIHTAVDQGRASLAIKPATKRDDKHKNRRHDLLLFYRFCIDEKDGRLVNISNTKRQDDDKAVERLLADWIDGNGVQTFRSKVNSFVSIVANHTALIHDIWREVSKGDRNRTINYTLYRWLLEIEIYRRSLGRSQSEYEQFVKQLWHLWAEDRSSSAARFPAMGEQGSPVTVALSKAPYQAAALSKQIGSDFLESKTRQRRKSKLTEARLGMHEGHIDPFATHGNGPTIAEPAARNMARGAKSIESIESVA